MTINALFDQCEIKYEIRKQEPGKQLYRIGSTNLLVWYNEGNIFKLNRDWFNCLSGEGERYSLLLVEKRAKKYYYLKFTQKNNWFSEGFLNCNKNELYLGKQILNYSKRINQIVADLMRCSNE